MKRTIPYGYEFRDGYIGVDKNASSVIRGIYIDYLNGKSFATKLPDGRVVLSWNNALGQPMMGVRYSVARQCLHTAVSYDGLKTLTGIRMIVKKRALDPDKVQNTYPWSTVKDENTVFVRPYTVDDAECSLAWEPEGFLLALEPDALVEKEMTDSFDEWVTDCEVTKEGIKLSPTVQDTAYACVNFSYAKSGELTLKAEGNIPDNMRILLSDCYIDRASFIMSEDEYSYESVLGAHFTEITPDASGEWHIVWDKEQVALTTNAKTERYARKDKTSGFNHMIVFFKDKAEVTISDFHMKAYETGLPTGIEY